MDSSVKEIYIKLKNTIAIRSARRMSGQFEGPEVSVHKLSLGRSTGAAQTDIGHMGSFF